jgi:alpha-L-fucosidase
MLLLCFFMINFLSVQAQQPTDLDTTKIVTPTDKQMQWADCEIGVLFHYDMPVFNPEYEWTDYNTCPPPSSFNPTALNTDQWLATAKKLGAKYAILVAKHCSGFSLWPTKAHDYSVKSSTWRDGKGDIVSDFIKSCHKYNILPGIYASTSANGYLHVNAHKLAPDAPITQAEYRKVVETQVKELWSNYGPLFEIWFDGGLLATDKGGADILSLVSKLQPGVIAFQGPFGYDNLIRWVGNEEGVAPYPCWATADSTTNADGTKVIESLNGNPNGRYWCPGESDFTLRWNKSFQGGWFWHANEDNKMFTLDEMIKKYETSVGRNTNMLLGVVIDNRGLVPDADAKRIGEIGKAIKRLYGTPLSQTSGKGNELAINFKKPTSIDRCIIQEDIKYGERILSYVVNCKCDGKWQTMSSGSNVGHKRIVRFQPTVCDAIQVKVTSSKATPILRNFAAFATE